MLLDIRYYFWVSFCAAQAQAHAHPRQEASSGAVTEPTPTVNAAARASAPGDDGAQRRVTLVANTNEDRALVPYQSEPGESR
jgi:hypothetical protein